MAQGRCNRTFTVEDLNDEANELSNYDGGGAYFGQNDDFLDFDGKTGSFADPVTRSKTYQITIANAAGATRVALLCPGLVPNRVGLIADGAFNDRDGNAGLSCSSGSPGTVAQFNWFIQKFPSLIVGVKLATDSVTQLDQSLTIQQESPFKIHSSKVIPFGTFQNENSFNTKILSVPEPFYMDQQTRIEVPILAGSALAMTFFVGTSLNIAKALREKTEKARDNMAVVGGPAVVQKALVSGRA